MIRDRGGKFPELFDAVLADAGITVGRTSVRMPRRAQQHLLRALREFEPAKQVRAEVAAVQPAVLGHSSVGWPASPPSSSPAVRLRISAWRRKYQRASRGLRRTASSPARRDSRPAR